MFIQQNVEDGYAVWRIDRPDRFNALGTNLAVQLAKLLDTSAGDLLNSRGLILRATPKETKKGKFWIAGGDLKELAALPAPHDYAQTMTDVCRKLETLPIPVITIVEGAAIGGGAEFALAGDIRIASNDSSLDFKQLAIGLATGYGGGKRLVDLVGKAWAQRLLYLPEAIDAHKAEKLGLFHKVVEAVSLETQIDAVKEHLATLHLPSFAAQKRMFDDACNSSDGDSAPHKELESFYPLWGNPLHKKSLERFR